MMFMVSKQVQSRVVNVLPFFLGFIAFWVIIGPRILNIYNSAWVHDEDQWQIYLSWIFFKNHSWTFPPGLNPSFGLDIPSSAAYNAGGFVLLFKPIASLFPGDVQFIGYWYLFCIVMQAWCAWKLLGLITADTTIKLMGAAFFIFSPPFLDRLGLHILLIEHFLILGALYLSLTNGRLHRMWWLAILVSSVSLMFYMFVPLAILWFFNEIKIYASKKGRISRNQIIWFFSAIGLVLLFAWLVGYFIVSAGAPAEWGFGYFRAHILTFFDSAGFHGSRWSYLIPGFPDLFPKDGLYELTFEGFAFLGLGLIVLALISIYLLITRKNHLAIGAFIKSNLFLFLAIAFLALIAFSNNLTFGPWNMQVPIPGLIYQLGSIVRSSGRMIWPAYYMSVFVILYVVIKSLPKNWATFVLGICLLAQIFDTSSGWLPQRENFMRKYEVNQREILKNAFWDSAASKYKEIRHAHLRTTFLKQPNWLPFAYLAAKNNLATNFIYQGRLDAKKIGEANERYDAIFASGNYDPNVLYVLGDDLTIPVLLHINPEKDLFARIDGFNVLAPGWNHCVDCPKLKDGDIIKKDLPIIELNKKISLSKSGLGSQLLIGVGQYERLGWGWSYPESWGVWSMGPKAKLILPFPFNVKPKKLELNMRGFTVSEHPLQRVEIWVNGKFSQSVALSEGAPSQIMIDVPLSNRDYVMIEFKLPDAVSPKKLGIGDDHRPLGIGLESFMFMN